MSLTVSALPISLVPGLPGNHRYIPVEWRVEASHGVTLLPTRFPPSETLHLPAIDETVPVYDGTVRLIRDIHMPGSREWPDELKDRNTLTLTGEFRYQACDARVCYRPTSIPLTWKLKLEPHDLTRIPQQLQRAARE